MTLILLFMIRRIHTRGNRCKAAMSLRAHSLAVHAQYLLRTPAKKASDGDMFSSLLPMTRSALRF